MSASAKLTKPQRRLLLRIIALEGKTFNQLNVNMRTLQVLGDLDLITTKDGGRVATQKGRDVAAALVDPPST